MTSLSFVHQNVFLHVPIVIIFFGLLSKLYIRLVGEICLCTCMFHRVPLRLCHHYRLVGYKIGFSVFVGYINGEH